MRWYYFLNRKGKRNLIDCEKIDNESLIIANWFDSKSYTSFESYIYFYDYMCEVKEKERCFFEILLPHYRRKPYFDIDMKDIPKGFSLATFIIKIKEVILAVIEDSSTTILVFNSHTETKYSYHIVIDGWYLRDNEECEEFFKNVTEKLPDEYVEYFDESVYKTTQQFRMIGSHKNGKNNVKVLNIKECHNFNIPKRCKNERGRSLYILYSSLVGKVERCQILRGFEPPVKEKFDIIPGSATENDLGEIVKLFKEHPISKKGSFEVLDLVEEEGNLVIPLKSHCPYHCDGCNRIHEAENPFLTVRGEERTILFDCRRGKNRQFIGKLGEVPSEEVPSKEVPSEEVPSEEVPSKEVKSIVKRPSPKRFDRLTYLTEVPEKYKPKVNVGLKFSLYS